MQLPSLRSNVLLVHLSFWCVYLSFLIYQMSNFMHGDHFTWVKMVSVIIIIITFTMSLAYINYFFLLPKFLQDKRAGLYILKLVLLFASAIFIRLHLERYIVDGYTYQAAYLYRARFIVYISFTSFFIVTFVGMLRFATDWFELEKKRKEVENEKLTAELTFLKAQINPHFLFNTLNNLYYLAYSKSANTTEVISKLSQMMRYMIYDSNYEKVSLSKEIEYIENYITLEKLRINDDTSILFEIAGNPGNLKITPFILITFLENAFKHGVSNTIQESYVSVHINISGNTCVYTVENSKWNGRQKEKEGIGLKNVLRRLELCYPHSHELSINNNKEKYFVQLKLILD